jgi:hypothetical protein
MSQHQPHSKPPKPKPIDLFYLKLSATCAPRLDGLLAGVEQPEHFCPRAGEAF